MSNVRFYLLIGLVMACFVGLIVNGTIATNNYRLINSELESIEGRILLHDGKAVLTNGEVCIIKNEALLDEELAVQLVRACVKAYQEEVPSGGVL